MSEYVVIGLLAGLPFLLAIILRVHTSALFISIASGYLLSSFVGETAGLLSSSFVKEDGTAMVAKLIVFFVPIVITMWLMRKGLAVSQLAFHFLPMVGCAVLVLLLGVPLLSQSTQDTFYAGAIGKTIQQTQDALVALSVAFQLIVMWIAARPRRAEAAHHGKHRK